MSEQNRDARPLAPAAQRTYPTVRAVSFADINEAWTQGLRDFRAAPTYGLVFGGLYAAGGIIVVLGATALGLGYLAYPLAAAFAMIGPFAAVGLYEVSRRQEAGLALSWHAVLGAIFNQRNVRLAWMGLITVLFFIAWICLVRVLIVLFLGTHSFPTLDDFLVALTLTSNGLWFLVLGHAVGAILSIALFSLSFVSFPLLLDRDIDVVTAMLTSVRAVIASPVVVLLRVAAETSGRRTFAGANACPNQKPCHRRCPGTGDHSRDAAVICSSRAASRRNSSGAAARNASDQRTRNGDPSCWHIRDGQQRRPVREADPSGQDQILCHRQVSDNGARVEPMRCRQGMYVQGNGQR